MSNFKPIIKYPQYERSESGAIIRNIKSKAIVGADKKTGSVRLYNTAGERVTINKKDFAIELATGEVKAKLKAEPKLKTEKVKPEKTAKVKKAKSEKVKSGKKRDGHCAKIRELFVAGKSLEDILAMGTFNPHTVYIQTKKSGRV